MKKIAFLVGLMFLACTSHAAFIDSQVDPSAYITKGGYDIAWASPLDVFSLDLSVQSSYGWSAMSYEMFNTLQISATDFVFSGANAKKDGTGWGDTATGAYVASIHSTHPLDDVAVATPWFSNSYKHIDWSDGVGGSWSFSNVNGEIYSDSLVYRVSSNVGNNVPEPASIALVGLGLAGIAASRRRKS